MDTRKRYLDQTMVAADLARRNLVADEIMERKRAYIEKPARKRKPKALRGK